MDPTVKGIGGGVHGIWALGACPEACVPSLAGTVNGGGADSPLSLALS